MSDLSRLLTLLYSQTHPLMVLATTPGASSETSTPAHHPKPPMPTSPGLIKGSANISAFQNTLQNPSPGILRVHLGGHQTIGGDAGSDFYK